MKIELAHLAACLPELETLSRLLEQERTAILGDDLAALETLQSTKTTALQALAGKLMSLNRPAPSAAANPESQSSAAHYRALKLLRQNFEHNRNNGVMLNLRAARKNARLAALLETNSSGYGRAGNSTQTYSPRRIALA